MIQALRDQSDYPTVASESASSSASPTSLEMGEFSSEILIWTGGSGSVAAVADASALVESRRDLVNLSTIELDSSLTNLRTDCSSAYNSFSRAVDLSPVAGSFFKLSPSLSTCALTRPICCVVVSLDEAGGLVFLDPDKGNAGIGTLKDKALAALGEKAGTRYGFRRGSAGPLSSKEVSLVDSS